MSAVSICCASFRSTVIKLWKKTLICLLLSLLLHLMNIYTNYKYIKWAVFYCVEKHDFNMYCVKDRKLTKSGNINSWGFNLMEIVQGWSILFWKGPIQNLWSFLFLNNSIIHKHLTWVFSTIQVYKVVNSKCSFKAVSRKVLKEAASSANKWFHCDHAAHRSTFKIYCFHKAFALWSNTVSLWLTHKRT